MKQDQCTLRVCRESLRITIETPKVLPEKDRERIVAHIMKLYGKHLAKPAEWSDIKTIRLIIRRNGNAQENFQLVLGYAQRVCGIQKRPKVGPRHRSTGQISPHAAAITI